MTFKRHPHGLSFLVPLFLLRKEENVFDFLGIKTQRKVKTTLMDEKMYRELGQLTKDKTI